MHPLINKEMVQTIRDTGKTSAHLPDRANILEKHGLPYDRPAENAIVTGCQILASLPRVLAALARILDRGGLSYTFLSEEYCCGNYLYRPVIAARDEEALAECRALSREFVLRTADIAQNFGARRLVIFCSPCYPVYKHALPDREVVFYPTAIREAMGRVPFHGRIDYYAGCYRLHKRISPEPMDLASTEEVFARMPGLEINRIGAPACCFKPDGIKHMVEHVSAPQMVHICTGCYGQARQHVPAEKGSEILMLPEFVERAMNLAGQA